MSGHDTMRRDGGWTVELITPVKDLGVIEFKPVGFDQVIRWTQGDIPSTLALMSELSGVPETVLRSLTFPDVDRVMFAFSAILPPGVRADFEKGAKPLATPRAELEAREGPLNDPVDPRFPLVDGQVQRFPPAGTGQGPQGPQDAGLGIKPPAAMHKVG